MVVNNKLTMDVTLRTALALAKKGIHVFPCRPKQKEPATAHGCKDATADADIIVQWWREQPDANLAVATGTASDIFVLDIDGLDAEIELRRLEKEHGTLPSSVESITARGRHVWFRYSTDVLVPNSTGKIAPGCDIRGNGGYVLAPPSIHPSGRRYEWSVDCAALAPAPEWLLDIVSQPATTGTQPLPPEQWRELVAGGAVEGTRDCTITKLAGHLLRRRIDPFVALELLQSWNATRCVPPLPAADIERIVASVAGRELRRRASA
jgi:Bifunctional DNA primase/polymerase, N-terminal/Primase C terminal 1 (PriCT-1)